MKNQYFGDVNDYRKYGLLRALQGEGNLSMLVAWMLTPDDGSTDGKFRRYLTEPAKWRHYDPPLYDHLVASMTPEARPAVSLIEDTGLLPRTRFFSQMVPDDRGLRAAWSQRLLDAARGVDLVFVDPDNGLEIKSKPMGRKGSSKFAAWSEVEALWSLGASVLVYQHFCREPREGFTVRLWEELRLRTGAGFVEAFSTPHVLFLLAGQLRHTDALRDGIDLGVRLWSRQVAAMGLSQGLSETS